MSKNHFISILLSEPQSLQRLSINNDLKSSHPLKDNEVTINIGESLEIIFIDGDLLQIISKIADIRIDLDIASIEQSIK